MCMEQYDRMFRCYREPCTPADILHYKPEENKREEHIIVICNNQANLRYHLPNSLLLFNFFATQMCNRCLIPMCRSELPYPFPLRYITNGYMNL